MRQPWNVYVYIFRKRDDGYEFLLLKRKDDGVWQGVAGGGEDSEGIEMAAHREAFEEAGLPTSIKLFKLDTMSYVETSFFDRQWGEDIYVIPMYYYAAEFDGEIRISSEHTEYGWYPYEEAQKLLYWHDNKTALWELNERLKSGKLK